MAKSASAPGRITPCLLYTSESVLLLGVDLGALQRLQDAHGDLVVVGEDPLGGGDVLNSAGIQPVDEQLLALAAAPAGVVGGLDGSDLLLGPAILLQLSLINI